MGVSVVRRGGAGTARGFARTAVAASALGVLFLLWLLSDLGSPRAETVVSDLVFVVAPLFSAWTCWQAHRREVDRDADGHTPWWWLSVGCLTWAVGSALFALPPGDLRRGAADPVAGGPGVRRLRACRWPSASCASRDPPGSVWSRWRAGLDSVVIAGCLLLTSAVLVLDPILNATVADLHAGRRVGLPARGRAGLLDRAGPLRRPPRRPPDGLGAAEPRAAGAVGDGQRLRRPELPRGVHPRRSSGPGLVRRVRARRPGRHGARRRPAARGPRRRAADPRLHPAAVPVARRSGWPSSPASCSPRR